MKSKLEIINLEGKKIKEIDTPKFFKEKIREDIVAKVLETKKIKQPYGPFSEAGKQHSASGKIVHRRNVWRSGYGWGISRIPRKIMSRRGSRFHWIGAEVASTRGGRRAHPPKPLSMMKKKKINKKEALIALLSALSSTANKDYVLKKYESLNEKDIRSLPIVIDTISINKIKDFIKNLKNILGKELFKVALKRKKIRSGKGKLRGRKYKKNAGILIVTGKNEEVKTNLLDVKKAQNVNVSDLAKGGLGRIVIYTENAIKELQERLK
ncbi:MAG: 50S ribosomal protein L4 [Candidatus Pacearchaeota archaeon]